MEKYDCNADIQCFVSGGFLRQMVGGWWPVKFKLMMS